MAGIDQSVDIEDTDEPEQMVVVPEEDQSLSLVATSAEVCIRMCAITTTQLNCVASGTRGAWA